MLNYFSDNKDLEFTLRTLELAEITGLLEDNYRSAEKFDGAPADFKDALDNYTRALKIIGEIAGERIEARSRTVDQVGAKFENGKVIKTILQYNFQNNFIGICSFQTSIF